MIIENFKKKGKYEKVMGKEEEQGDSETEKGVKPAFKFESGNIKTWVTGKIRLFEIK